MTLFLTADHHRNTDDFKIIAAAFDIRTSSWSSAFSFWGNWFDVKTTNWQTNNQRYVNVVPASLLLNQDKSFRAFGYEAEEQYDDAKDDEKRDIFFFQRITTAFESSMHLVRTFVLNRLFTSMYGVKTCKNLHCIGFIKNVKNSSYSNTCCSYEKCHIFQTKALLRNNESGYI